VRGAHRARRSRRRVRRVVSVFGDAALATHRAGVVGHCARRRQLEAGVRRARKGVVSSAAVVLHDRPCAPRMACRKDVHTGPLVVDNCHVAVDKRVDKWREATQRPRFSAANRPICAVSAVARLPFRPSHLVSYALNRRCRTRRKETLISRLHEPRGGQPWPPQATRSMRRAPRKPTQFPGPPLAANGQARLAWDLAVLIESGLVEPVQDGETIRYAVRPTGDAAAA
jgi:hypothetical protein